MRDTLTIGRIAGIRFGVSWTWPIVFALIVWTLARGVFPETNPGLARSAHVAMALVAALLFFGSLLAHELGHALVAQREGMAIDGITLWLLGGVARFRSTFPSAGAEFRIAVAGPAVSLVLGLAFAAAAWLARLPEEVDAVAAWLGYINLTLAVFNLLPALPLDGGRVLRAALWRYRGDFGWATVVAAGISRGFGFVLVVGGGVLLVWQSAFSGVWLMLVGLFLLQAAAAEVRFLPTQRALRGLRVRELMTTAPLTARADATVGEFVYAAGWSRQDAAYLVTDNGHVVGLVPFRRLARVPRRESSVRTVREYMTPLEDVPIVQSDDDVVAAAGELADSDVGGGFVLEGERLVGVLSLADVTRVLEAGTRRNR